MQNDRKNGGSKSIGLVLLHVFPFIFLGNADSAAACMRAQLPHTMGQSAAITVTSETHLERRHCKKGWSGGVGNPLAAGLGCLRVWVPSPVGGASAMQEVCGMLAPTAAVVV